VKDLIRAVSNPREQRTIRSLTREVLLVPENLSVEGLLARFRSKRQQIAIVLDEFGGTAGLVTLEDIIEELVGELADQFETTRPDTQRLKDGTVSISGLMNIADFNESFNFHLVDTNYDTLGGYVMGRLERIPIVGDKIALDGGATLRVEAMDGMRIERLSLVPVLRVKPEKTASA
jgi:CBS domain containing-hemolysin-like protein